VNTNRICIVVALTLTVGAGAAFAHCQVPCGIYDDPARVDQLSEDAATITKSIQKIQELSSKHDPQAFNQAARWVATKDAHASNIIETVSKYFLTQKVKPVAAGAEGHDAYLETLAACHAVMVAAMKTKQKCDANAAKALDAAIAALDERW
jgi:nickel superoxide dismutase